MEQDKLSFIGEINLDKVEIISSIGKRVDVRGIMMDFGLYEDIFANTMSGYMILEDSLNLIDEFPLIGEELLEVELQTPTLTTKIKKRFYIYKCSGRKRIKKRMDTYTLHFCSVEAITSANTKISKAFSGNISDSIEKIVSDPKLLGSSQTLYTNKTKNSYTFIPAFWTPLETINWLSLRSIDKDGSPNYLFYETNQSFEYCSMNELLSFNAERRYIYSDVDASTVYGSQGDKDLKYKIVMSMDSDVVFDYLKNLKAGMYAGKLYTYDLTTKDIRSTTYDYLDKFYDDFHTQKGPYNKEGGPYPMQSENLFRKSTATQYFIEKNNYLFGSFKQQGHIDFFLRRISLMQQMVNFKLLIEVQGRTDIKVGQVIYLDVPDAKDIDKEDLVTQEVARNHTSGQYLITAIRHSITNGKHRMLMEVLNDSFIRQLNKTPTDIPLP